MFLRGLNLLSELILGGFCASKSGKPLIEVLGDLLIGLESKLARGLARSSLNPSDRKSQICVRREAGVIYGDDSLVLLALNLASAGTNTIWEGDFGE